MLSELSFLYMVTLFCVILNMSGCLHVYLQYFQGMEIIRDAKMIADQVGYDPETGLHMDSPPTPKEPANHEDCKCMKHLFFTMFWCFLDLSSEDVHVNLFYLSVCL